MTTFRSDAVFRPLEGKNVAIIEIIVPWARAVRRQVQRKRLTNLFTVDFSCSVCLEPAVSHRYARKTEKNYSMSTGRGDQKADSQ